MQDPFEQRDERRARFTFGSIVFVAGMILGGYFVVAKTKHDGQIADDTRRVAEAVERMEMNLRPVSMVKTHPYIPVTCDDAVKAANPGACR